MQDNIGRNVPFSRTPSTSWLPSFALARDRDAQADSHQYAFGSILQDGLQPVHERATCQPAQRRQRLLLRDLLWAKSPRSSLACSRGKSEQQKGSVQTAPVIFWLSGCGAQLQHTMCSVTQMPPPHIRAHRCEIQSPSPQPSQATVRTCPNTWSEL